MARAILLRKALAGRLWQEGYALGYGHNSCRQGNKVVVPMTMITYTWITHTCNNLGSSSTANDVCDCLLVLPGLLLNPLTDRCSGVMLRLHRVWWHGRRRLWLRQRQLRLYSRTLWPLRAHLQAVWRRVIHLPENHIPFIESSIE